MSVKTGIQWTDRTWNPVRGCSRVSEGCRNCYAERVAARFTEPGMPFHGFAKGGSALRNGSAWTGRVELVPDKLRQPLSWRKPCRVFVNSMSDLFHESLSDEAIDRVFAVMALAPWHTFQVLTKRADRMRRYLNDPMVGDRIHGEAMKINRAAVVPETDPGWPFEHVWLGVSVENQEMADERIPHLLATPAAVRFLSCEPLLGPVDLSSVWLVAKREPGTFEVAPGIRSPNYSARPGIDQAIIGGESGPGARPCDVAWIRSIVAQFKAAEVPVFVKQLGARPEIDQGCDDCDRCAFGQPCTMACPVALKLRDRKGGDPSEWPEDLRVREMPATKCGA